MVKAWTTVDGTIVCVDQQFQDYAGWGAGELLGSTITLLATEPAELQTCAKASLGLRACARRAAH